MVPSWSDARLPQDHPDRVVADLVLSRQCRRRGVAQLIADTDARPVGLTQAIRESTAFLAWLTLNGIKLSQRQAPLDKSGMRVAYLVAIWDGEHDAEVRAAAIAYVRRITGSSGGVITRHELEAFVFERQQIKLIDQSRGIRNPVQLPASMTIMTNPAGRYDDTPSTPGALELDCTNGSAAPHGPTTSYFDVVASGIFGRISVGGPRWPRCC